MKLTERSVIATAATENSLNRGICQNLNLNLNLYFSINNQKMALSVKNSTLTCPLKEKPWPIQTTGLLYKEFFLIHLAFAISSLAML